MNIMNRVILHGKDIILNKKKLKNILDGRGMSYIDFHEKVVNAYKLDLTYKGFMSLMDNRSSWKLLYAHAMTDVLNIKISDIFDVIEIDIDKKIEEKKVWREKYQKEK